MRKVYFFLFFSALQSVWAYAQNDTDSDKPVSIEFHVINADIFFELFHRQVDFYDLFHKKTAENYPEKIYDKYYHIQLYLRAGLPDKARFALEDFIAAYPNLTSSTASYLYDEVSKFGYPRLSSLILDSYGHRIVGKRTKCFYSGIESYRCFNSLQLFRDLKNRDGWRLSGIENWIKRNPKIEEVDKLYLKMMLFTDFRQEEKVKAFAKELAQRIYQERNDINRTIDYLQIIWLAGRQRLNSCNIDFSWIRNEIQPAYSTDALHLSRSLGALGYGDQSEHFLRQALSIELQAKDYEYLNSFRSRRLPAEILKVSYTISLKESLSKHLLARGEKEEAHALMVETLELSKQSHIKPNMVFAGRTQRDAGIYKVEAELIDKEESMADSVEYWKNRYSYYMGREDMEKAEYALTRRIDLLTSKYPRDTLHLVAHYQDAMSSYCWILVNTKRRQQALKLLRHELKHSGESFWSKRIIRDIADYFTEADINPWDEVFWDYLGSTEHWNEDFIKLLIKSCGEQEKDSMFFKLDRLATNAATRAFNLANSIYAVYPEKSIPYFEFARLNYPDVPYYGEYNKEESAKRLVDLYINSGDYKKAESVMYQMKSKYIEGFVVSKMQQLAFQNASDKNFSESMRLWSVAQNLNPSDTEYLSALCDVGMSPYLIEYYLGNADKIPKSKNSQKAIKEIRRIEKARKHNK